MARSIRIEYEEATYHVMARGNRRMEIYEGDADRELFLQTLVEASEQYKLRIHAYCLMSNHYHLLLRTPFGNLARGVGWLQFMYTIRWNRRHWRVGHLFQGRYRAQLVEEDSYAKQLLAYIHLNPVRIGVRKGDQIPPERWVELKRYRWSSHRVYGGWEKKPEWLDLSWQQYFGRTPAEARREYRRCIHRAFHKGMENPWEELKQGLILGGEQFCDKVKGWMGKKTGEPEQRWLVHNQLAARRARVQRALEQESDPRIKIWLRIKLGHEPKASVGRELGYRDGVGIHMVVQRLEQKARLDKQLLRKLHGYARSCEV